MKRYVILGGGYGGLAIISRLLEGDLPSDVQLVLVDRMPYQGLKTEYYALAAGTVSDMDIRVSFPNDPRVHLHYGNVQSIDLDGQLVHFTDGDTLIYDHLVIGLGCTDKYHGIPGAEQFGNSIQSLASTRRTYQLLNDIRPYGQVSIVGGGLSGVEMAAELRESRPDINIRILDRGSRVLSAFPEKLSHFVSGWFLEHHIELRSFVNVSHLEEGVIYNRKEDNEEEILSDVTVWTAGIQPVIPVQQLQVAKDQQGRVIINEYHHIPEYPNVYVVGDCASLPFSPSAQAAGAQGEQIADVIRARWKGETPQLGKIKLKGVLGALGKKSGFGVVGKRAVVGYVPRVIKSGVLWMSKHHFG
ncbi:NAD(P)/FAD-dependent oxidoreductase [Paenibacillus alvei]|uniref:NAD(P)/FAD-dependent oxidoreductase n=1 Tax=Paenibacillus alvei TaxID=44250 RepID=A0AAP7A245_PAEAL|nr:NAD(P)/FAD-dependent oxidoreductase [Paenibacillus alvei]MBG9734669.1 NADH dehydrogenase [Paenibacillus alvei]MBG9743020.1 NADH dehydrogenase [Paenibacillus alvei]MCY7483495.1 NAD(P)/FAD-dependent oxidoreductase [Paenibacillus alvei]MCY9582111.1 NAD(P)/FAD-dependent oxidoreductase [Paenibacillus alvei]MCY9587661.1 NAD(P)/FAD-dependent oxidoreductase [Paenibacillus alvei]